MEWNNANRKSKDDTEPTPEPTEAWVVAWDGAKQVKLHRLLNQFTPARAVIESGGSLVAIEMAADVYPDERNACIAGWMKRMEEAAAKMKQAEAFKKRADELNKTIQHN